MVLYRFLPPKTVIICHGNIYTTRRRLYSIILLNITTSKKNSITAIYKLSKRETEKYCASGFFFTVRVVGITAAAAASTAAVARRWRSAARACCLTKR